MCRLSGCDLQSVVVVIAGVTATPHFNEHLSRDLVIEKRHNYVVKVWSAALAEHRRSRRCRVLLVDETSMRKRHRYVTVIVNGDTGQTLAMVQHRSSAALSTFLMQQGQRWCKGVKVVVSDGSKAYKSAIDAHLVHARHVLDRFHVIPRFRAGPSTSDSDAGVDDPATGGISCLIARQCGCNGFA